MPSNKVIIDSSYLYTLFDPDDNNHARVLASAKTIRDNLVVLNVTLTETVFLFSRNRGMPAVRTFIAQLIRNQPQLESVTFHDLERASEVMGTYPTAELDFVDCCLTAVAERLDITQIATLDRRDFSIIRPKHCDYFELIP